MSGTRNLNIKALYDKAKQNDSVAFSELMQLSKAPRLDISEKRQLALYLGVCCLHGYGTPKNPQNAQTFLAVAAKQNDDVAMCILGDLHVNGALVTDIEVAANWYYQSILQQTDHSDGSQLAVKKLQALARAQTNGFAMYLYANCLFEGKKGIVKNKDEAYKLFEKAANLKCSLALVMLGKRYDAGDGVKQNKTIAADYYLEAAKHSTDASIKIFNPHTLLQEGCHGGITHDQFLRNLAICYMQGYAVEKSLINANSVLRRRGKFLFTAMTTNKIENLERAQSIYLDIYKTIATNHLELLASQTTQEAIALVSILRSLVTHDILLLIKDQNLKSALSSNTTSAAQDVLTLIKNYDVIQAGLERIHEQTKTCLLEIKKDLETHVFYVENWAYGIIPKSDEFVVGQPSCVDRLKNAFKNLTATSSREDVKKCWSSALTAIDDRSDQKRHPSTSDFYAACKRKLNECRMFTLVAHASDILIQQQLNRATPSLPVTVPAVAAQIRSDDSGSLEHDDYFGYGRSASPTAPQVLPGLFNTDSSPTQRVRFADSGREEKNQRGNTPG